MEHCFRVAVCLVLFLAHLQARPILDDLGLDFLMKDVSCENVTFTSPTNVQKLCCSAAFECIMGQLEQAKTNCTDEQGRIAETLETLEVYSSVMCPQSVQTNSSDCKWENQKSQKTLANFVGDIETFVQLLNTMQ